jgi:hypothetical protein
MGVAAIGQDCNYQLDILKVGRKRGKKCLKKQGKPWRKGKTRKALEEGKN